MIFRSFLSFCFLLCTSGTLTRCLAQSYGLGFESFEVVQDKRTGLDLSPAGAFCFNGDFELSFELSFLKNKKIYFGYIVRVIGDDRQNIDVIYDNSSVRQDHFKVIIGEEFAPVAFDFPADELFSKWNAIRLRFQKERHLLTVTYGNRSFSQPVTFAPKGCYKILFGANRYKEFRTTDVPPMKIRNVALWQDGRQAYHWPLDETDGNDAAEAVGGRSAQAVNPVWIRKLHFEWKLLQSFGLQGYARAAFDSKNGTVIVAGQDSLVRISIAQNHRTASGYRSGRQPVYIDNQLLFDTSRNRLYNIFVNEKQVTAFDTATRSWDKSDIPPSPKTRYLHANKFLSQADSSIYVIGGYGHLTYRKDVQRYHLPTHSWERLAVADSSFAPRYLAALGATSAGAYVIGGYGSSTGQQMLNPRNWYDLSYFDRPKRTMSKVFEFKLPREDFVFANSMIVNERDSTYYALVFPKDKFASELQLIRGSLLRPEFRAVGSKVPYRFVDIDSFADLFYDEVNGQFLAVTIFREASGQSKVSLYSLNAPPLEKQASPQTAGTEGVGIGLILTIALILTAMAAAYLFYRYFWKPARSQSMQRTVNAVRPADYQVLTPSRDTLGPASAAIEEEEQGATAHHNCILLFGNLQLYDADGNEITKMFSPLVKELFLVILLYSIRWDGISSEKLKELLWFDKPSESARNNRSVNIAKLKAILEKMKYCQVSKETGYWKIKIDFEKIDVDYMHYLALVGNGRQLSKQHIIALARITSRGSFLSNVEYEWLDVFKSEISNEIVDAYLRYAASVKIADDAEFLVKLANYIFYFDPVNEEAMILKCKALAHLGKHSLAKTTFENFAREYSRIYGEDFRKDMSEVLQS